MKNLLIKGVSSLEQVGEHFISDRFVSLTLFLCHLSLFWFVNHDFGLYEGCNEELNHPQGWLQTLMLGYIFSRVILQMFACVDAY